MNDAGSDVLDQQFGPPMMLTANLSSAVLIGPLELDSSRSYISSITMSAPSPDWYSGFYDFQPIADSGMWYDSFVIQTYPWDAGTDAGSTYLSDDMPIDPPLWIYQLTATTVPTSGVFLNPEGDTVLPVATWSCTVEAAPDTGDDDEPTSGTAVSLSTWACGIVPLGVLMLFNLM